eukprot:6173501-Pleurochrysis_carterae.AAC.2
MPSFKRDGAQLQMLLRKWQPSRAKWMPTGTSFGGQSYGLCCHRTTQSDGQRDQLPKAVLE